MQCTVPAAAAPLTHVVSSTCAGRLPNALAPPTDRFTLRPYRVSLRRWLVHHMTVSPQLSIDGAHKNAPQQMQFSPISLNHSLTLCLELYNSPNGAPSPPLLLRRRCRSGSASSLSSSACRGSAGERGRELGATVSFARTWRLVLCLRHVPPVE